MNTAEAIEAMTDAGQFEILATRVLRLKDPDFSLILHTGVNAAGQTIKCPVDGFCQVPNTTPPRFVMAGFTIADSAKLRTKWLHDSKTGSAKTPDGDLVKAIERAIDVRKIHANAEFRVALCCNHSPSDDLVQDVVAKAAAGGVTVTVVDRSVLRDALDTSPEGHYLRKTHLGISAELLSEDLLIEVSSASLSAYADEHFFVPSRGFVETATTKDAIQLLHGGSTDVLMPLARSGAGKSALAYQLLEQHVVQGGIGLWISGDTVEASESLPEAIEAELRRRYPSIAVGCGQDAIKFANSRCLLLVFDDLNRTSNPQRQLEKVIRWCVGRNSGDAEGSGKGGEVAMPDIKGVVPAWHRSWKARGASSIPKGVRELEVPHMTVSEAVKCLLADMPEGTDATPAMTDTALALAHDPILLAMYSVSKRRLQDGEAGGDPSNVLHEYLQMATRELADAGEFLDHEYREALEAVVTLMLERRDLYPDWTDVRSSLDGGHVTALRRAADQGFLCRVVPLGGGKQQFEFRHDRILEHVAAGVMARWLSNPGDHIDVLADPHYAKFLGRAIAGEVPDEATLQWIEENAPLSLIAALTLLSGAEPRSGKVADHAAKWLELLRSSGSTPSALWAASRMVMGACSDLVRKATEPVAEDFSFAQVRLINGDIENALVEMSGRGVFRPEMTDRQFDQTLERAMVCQKQQIVESTTELLQRTDLNDPQRESVLTLAGFLAAEELSDHVYSCWAGAKEPTDLLVAGVWAGLRCTSDRCERLDPLLDAWASLPEDTHEGDVRSQRSEVAERLRFAVKRGVSESAMAHLLARGRSDPELRSAILWTVNNTRDPSTVPFIVEEAARRETALREAESKGAEPFDPWLITFYSDWDPLHMGRGDVPQTARDVLKTTWQDGQLDNESQQVAFRLWVRSCTDANELRAIEKDHELYDVAFWRRVTLADRTTVPELVARMPLGHWQMRHLGKVWDPALLEYVDGALGDLRENTPTDYSGGQLDVHHSLARLLIDLPADVAKKSLEKHWEHLKFSPLFVQAALYIGTEELKAMAANAIDAWPLDRASNPLAHVSMFFGFRTYGRSERLNMGHIEALLPHLELLDWIAVQEIVEYCVSCGRSQWIRGVVSPELQRRKELSADSDPIMKPPSADLLDQLFPTDEALKSELGDVLARSRGSNEFWPNGQIFRWVDDFERRGDVEGRWSKILQAWCESEPSASKPEIAAIALKYRGSRRDLAWFADLCGKLGDDAVLAELQADVEFGVKWRTLK